MQPLHIIRRKIHRSPGSLWEKGDTKLKGLFVAVVVVEKSVKEDCRTLPISTQTRALQMHTLQIYVSKLSSAPPQLVCVTLRLRLTALAPEHKESTMVVMLDGQAEASSSTVSVMLPLFDNSKGVSQSVEPLTSCEIQAKRVRFHEKKSKSRSG